METSPLQTLAQASTAPNVSGAMQSLLLSRAHSPEESQQLSQNRQASLQKYQETLEEPSMGTFTPTEQGMYSWVENMGKMQPFAALTSGVAAGGRALRDSQVADQANRVKAAQAGYTDAQDLDRMDDRELAALKMGRSLGPNGGMGKYIQFKDDKGNLYIMNNATGDKQVIPASQSPLWAKAFQLGINKAVETRQEDPQAFATDFANRAVQNSPAAQTNETTQTLPQKPVAPQADLNFVEQGKSGPQEMAPEKIQGMISRIQDPAQRAEAQSAFDAKYGAQPVKPEAPKPGLAPRDLRGEARSESYGKGEGSELLKERNLMTDLHGANNKLISQLNMLEHLYQNPDIPEGELAPQIQGLRSGLKSLGVDVAEGVGLADMVRAISTNLALGMKNADGHNMLPGAMSNYEDQLLQKMAPTLSMTQQGRLGMIRFMKEVAASNLRLASEASKMTKDNKEALPPEWNRRKERVMLEEMARLKDLSQEISKKYGAR